MKSCIIGITLCSLWLARDLRAATQIGRVSGSFGSGRITGDGGQRKVGVATGVNNNDTISTGATDAASLLLDSNVVISLDNNTAIKLTETDKGTDVQLEHGTIQVHIGDRGKRGPVAVVDGEGGIEAAGTVFLALYSAANKESLYACEESSLKVRPRAGAAVNVAAGQLARVQNGSLRGVEKLEPNQFRKQFIGLGQLSAQTANRNVKISKQRADQRLSRPPRSEIQSLYRQ